MHVRQVALSFVSLYPKCYKNAFEYVFSYLSAQSLSARNLRFDLVYSGPSVYLAYLSCLPFATLAQQNQEAVDENIF